MLGVRDALNAFLDYPEIPVGCAPTGPLAGCTLGVKDIFDIAGYPTGGGNPAWLAESPIASKTQPAVQALLDAGAQFIGKTQTDEFAYSMIGMNAHFPPPVNARARQRVTGGSSSGSAAAIAGGLADIAVGSDTNGSIRAPASFCGLVGLRTTSGRIPLEVTLPLARSFDTFGWFARDMAIYARVGEVLLGEDGHATALSRPVRIAELEALLFGEAERAVYGEMLRKVLSRFDGSTAFLAMPRDPGTILASFRDIQAYEAWQIHGPFISGAERNLGPGVKERFDYARTVTAAQAARARAQRRGFAEEFSGLFDDDMVLILPSQPSAAPLKQSTQVELERYRTRASTLTAFAGFLGWPQITIPLGSVHDAPFGISLLGPAGTDRQLIGMAAEILMA